jgi:hypothetical protein
VKAGTGSLFFWTVVEILDRKFGTGSRCMVPQMTVSGIPEAGFRLTREGFAAFDTAFRRPA